jgi:hypothetical protein
MYLNKLWSVDVYNVCTVMGNEHLRPENNVIEHHGEISAPCGNSKREILNIWCALQETEVLPMITKAMGLT